MRNISAISGVLIIILTLTGAFAFALTDFMDYRLFGKKRVFFVVLLFAYAAYRCFRLYTILTAQRKQD